ncbi:2Fe-2S iron-sulfur cluster-binding protein [soil metagenome]
MARITFIQHNGTEQTVDGLSGMSVMEAAVKNFVPGIDADCGGACACATCHVYVDPDWAAKTGPRSAMEEDMLDFAFDVQESSRLSCQIKISDALDGLRVRVPEKQF